MREIKFRAWDGKRMINRHLTDRNWYNDKNLATRVGMPNDIRALEIMQFINQKDWRGRELYEGDIVLVEYKRDEPFKAVIEFSDQLPGFILRTLEHGKILELNRLAMMCDGEITLTGVELIGNIYESELKTDPVNG